MITRILAVVLGVFNAGNALYMLAAPRAWFAAAPSAPDTGPFNMHFVYDVGFAFLAGGVAFLAFALRPKLKLVAFGASGFLVFHALLHLSSVATGHMHHLATDALALPVPAFLGLAITWPSKSEW